jgi:hypothetical protein
MLEQIKRDTLFADLFFFPETNDWHNHESGNFQPLYDYQLILDEAINDHDVVWIQGHRGAAKTSGVARSVDKYLLRVPNQECKIVGRAFRQSKIAYGYCLNYMRKNFRSNNANLLYNLERDLPPDNIREGNDQRFDIPNGSSCQALPSGDGETLRGGRANFLWIEEAYLMDRTFVVSHVKPFLNVKKGNRPNKIVYVTTSYYQDVYAYEVLMEIAAEIKAGSPRHFIVDIALDDVVESQRIVLPEEADDTPRSFPLDKRNVLDMLNTERDASGNYSDEVRIAMFNEWIKSSDNYFRSDKVMESQTAEVPLLEHRPKDFPHPFVLGVDPAGVGTDACEMAVGSLPGDNVRHVNAVWKWAKQSPEEIAGHIHKMVDLYGMAYIVMDKTGSLGADIAAKCASPMQLIDGTWQERVPITTFNHADEASARAHIILTKPSDEYMQMGFIGPHGGERIESEIALKNVLLREVRSCFENGRIKCALELPDSSYEDRVNGSVTKGELLENIKEALVQFPKVDRVKGKDGKPVRDTKGNYQFTRPNKDDGAFAVTYMSYCANIVYNLGKRKTPEAVTTEVVWDNVFPSYPVDDNGGWGPRPRLF